MAPTTSPPGTDPDTVALDAKGPLPSTFVTAAYGAIAGAILGAANGFALHYVIGPPITSVAGSVWGTALGTAVGIAYALVDRVRKGAGSGHSIGTTLGACYGFVPGVAVLIQSGAMVVGRAALWFLAGSMIGILAGAILDRIFDSIARPRA